MYDQIVREEIRAAISGVNFAAAAELAALQQKVTLNEREVSKLYGWSIRTLQQWRTQGIGPRYIKGVSKVTYRRSDLDSYVSSMAVKTRDQQ